MGLRGRARIETELTLEAMARGHGELYRRALGLADPRPLPRAAEARLAGAGRAAAR
jgi:hypothetical protein